MGRATRVQKHKRNSLEPDGQLPMRSGRALLYDAGSSTLGGDSERSVVTAANTYFAGFAAVLPNEDEGSEITDKMNNLSLAAAIAPPVPAPRKNPRQSMVQRQKLHQAWLIRHPEHEQDLHSHSRIGRFGEDGNDEESPSNHQATAAVTDSDQNNNALLNDDSEVPTNNDCSETRTTTTTSVHGDEVQKDGYCWRREDIYESTSILVASHASSSHADGSVSIGIVPHDQFRSRVPCDILTRWVFLLACLLTLWLSVEQLTWAEKHQQPNLGSRRLVRGSSEVPSLRMTDEHQHLALPSSSSQPAATANAIEGQDQDLVSGESIQWDSLTTGQMEQAVSFGFTKKKEFDSSSSSRQEPPPAPPANAEQQPLQTATVSRPSPQPPTSETTEEPLPELTLGISEEEKEHAGSAQAASSSMAPSASPTLAPSSSNQALNEETVTNIANSAGEELEPTSVVQGTQPLQAESTSMPREEDDDQDNDKDDKTILVVFQINGVLVTKTMVLAFAASLCFTIVGITEWIQHDRLFQLSLAVAGVLGLLSAMVEVRHSLTSRMLHSLSVHWILAASVLILWARCQEASSSNLPPQNRSRRRAIHRTKEEALLLADVFFAVGALIAVFASYVSFGDDTAHLNIGVQAAGVCTAIMWVGCAVLYLCCSCSNSRYHELS